MNAKPKSSSRVRPWLIAGVVVVCAVFAWRYFSGGDAAESPAQGGAGAQAQKPGGGQGGGRRAMRRSPVQVAETRSENVPNYLSGLGTVTAANTVTVLSRVDGQLMKIHFTEGQQVKAGDLLAEIDPRPFEVQLTQAQGQLAKDQAILANAKRDLARYQSLAKTNMVSRQELDTQASLVTQTQASIEADKGAVDSAKLQLTYSRITAPIDGRVGLKLVDEGNYITSGGSTGLVVITQTHPIDVLFTLPESDIRSIQLAQKSGPLTVEAWDRANQNLLTTGTLLSLDNQIDATTGTIKIKARFDNQDDILFPNQFVNARLKVSTQDNAVVAPAAAVQMGNEGSFVWVLGEGNKVSKHLVTTGTRTAENVVITGGLSAGERVVTDGIDQLTEGMQVEVVQPVSASAGGEAKPARAEGARPARQEK
ncbi:MdtA/MuxA family multidrug efflux RND transporter periplasmic adaptor subunit [Enterobacillus tribolii]|uniref:Multidrug resistance protein MdtA n=1 Tax=Enterobacillus tribolii TaxID=1487935 RepID=A0A370QT19_9GAMM|nr:MdtA/MuxA family multidrug efflux RND transporter periplasmic adaptor subunit [Enterobacillus tribolii]MBW7983442.1 MdtA/MuxA family multidrug efflux RND transporter periplasmic adaptor subunit [Enterobacillus tribolii]RDK92063.1 multidrug efflux system membrane fusion protein [Enterobacillus tribolii]